MSDKEPQEPPPQFDLPQAEFRAGDAKKRSHRNALILGAVSVAAFLCLCASVAALSNFVRVGRTATNKDDVVKTIDSFMTAMSSRDSDRAYALLSTRGKKRTNRSDINLLLFGNNYSMFNGYHNVNISNLRVNYSLNLDPDAPQGTVANVSGSVTYSDGYRGTLRATLEQENNEWKVYDLTVVVPPSKFRNEQKSPFLGGTPL